MSEQPHCGRCASSGWVCEEHTDEPYAGEHKCGCGADGIACPDCNTETPPRFLADAKIMWSAVDGWTN